MLRESTCHLKVRPVFRWFESLFGTFYQGRTDLWKLVLYTVVETVGVFFRFHRV